MAADPSESMPSDVQKVFNRIDSNGDGKISASELGDAVRALGTQVSGQELDAMIEEMDSNRDGFVDPKEFAAFHKGGGDDAELKEAFEMYDLDKNGLISAKELQSVMERLGEKKCSVKDCERMIRGVDADGDGLVNFQEFRKMMNN